MTDGASGSSSTSPRPPAPRSEARSRRSYGPIATFSSMRPAIARTTSCWRRPPGPSSRAWRWSGTVSPRGISLVPSSFPSRTPSPRPASWSCCANPFPGSPPPTGTSRARRIRLMRRFDRGTLVWRTSWPLRARRTRCIAFSPGRASSRSRRWASACAAPSPSSDSRRPTTSASASCSPCSASVAARPCT
jgi:hypothetical protein